MKQKYIGVKTESTHTPIIYYNVNNPNRRWWEFWKPFKIEQCKMGEPITDTYYEKAFDAKGIGLDLGDEVKIMAYSEGQKNMVNEVRKIVEIFQNDLVLQDKQGNCDYCWPRNVTKI